MSTTDTADPTAMRPSPHPSVETAFLAPEAVLFDDRHGEIHHLNPSASAVWLMLDGELSIVEVTAELSEIFGVPEADMLPDVESVLEDFRTRGLLEGTAEALPVASGDHDAPSGEDSEGPDDVSPRIETLARPPDT